MVAITLSKPFKILCVTILITCLLYGLRKASNSDNRSAMTQLTWQDRNLRIHHKLNRVIAHLRTKYVPNRTPYEDAPPLMVLYSCNALPCGPWAKRLKDITTAFYLAVSLDGTAYAVDMTAPIRLEWYFDTDPAGSVMTTDQAHHYLKLHGKSKTGVAIDGSLNHETLANVDLNSKYRSSDIRVLQTRNLGNWMELTKNPILSKNLKSYDLQTLSEDEWFAIARRFLFAKPSEWFRGLLEPYRNIMGGRVDSPRSLSLNDPETLPTTEEQTTFRIGVHITDKKHAECFAKQSERICESHAGDRKCYLFISSANAEATQALRVAAGAKLTVRDVDSSYPYVDLDDPYTGNENNSKIWYARVIMEWTILTRMDYLIGSDEFTETAAWVAQSSYLQLRQDGCQEAVTV